MKATDLRVYVVAPVLRHLGCDSLAMQNLILGTAAQESHLGDYLVQLGAGPARGIYQCEPATHDDIHANFLKYKSQLRARVLAYMTMQFSAVDQLVWNLGYATAICACHYLRYEPKNPIPAHDDIEGLGQYYKKFYNTPKGKATVAQFVENYERSVARVRE